MISRYKKDDITKEKNHEILEAFVSTIDLNYKGCQLFKYVMENLMQDICWENGQYEIDFVRFLVYNFNRLIRMRRGKVYGIFIIETDG